MIIFDMPELPNARDSLHSDEGHFHTRQIIRVLAQRGFNGGRIDLFGTAAGKADLAGVVRKVVGALREAGSE